MPTTRFPLLVTFDRGSSPPHRSAGKRPQVRARWFRRSASGGHSPSADVSPRASPRRRGFTLVESLTAIAVTTIAGAALLTSATAAVQSSTELSRMTIARGLAEQLMDEVAGTRFPDGVTPRASHSLPRATFDDVDDFAGWSASPPVDRNGRAIGTEGIAGTVPYQSRPASLRPAASILNRYSQEIQVERVQPNGTNGWTVVSQHTPYRRVTVRVKYTDARSITATLATISRIIAEVKYSP